MESDPNCHEKKKFIGNDHTEIVYNESGEEYTMNTIKVSRIKSAYFSLNLHVFFFIFRDNSTTHRSSSHRSRWAPT